MRKIADMGRLATVRPGVCLAAGGSGHVVRMDLEVAPSDGRGSVTKGVRDWNGISPVCRISDLNHGLGAGEMWAQLVRSWV